METYISIIVSVVLAIVASIGTALLTLGKYKQKVDTLEDNIKTLQQEMKDLSKSVTACETRLEERQKYTPENVVKRRSPVTLSGVGTELLKKSGGDKFVDEHLNDLIERIKQKSPKTAYDVQVLSQEVLKDIQNDDIFNPIKDFAFKEGTDLDVMFVVMGIYLRDIAIPKLGYKMSDVDMSDPTLIKSPPANN